MVDAFERWCIFYDCDSRVVPPDGPPQALHDYADAIIQRAAAGEAKRTYENGNRVARLAQARKVTLKDGSPGLAFVVTMGDKRGANPSFLHFDGGKARDPEREEGEVLGSSCHCILRLTPDPDHDGRYRLLVEERSRLGRSPLELLFNHELREQADIGNDRFLRQSTGSEVKTRLHVDLNTRQSQQMADAVEQGGPLPIELTDTSIDPTWDEDPDFTSRGKKLYLVVTAAAGVVGAALERLKQKANATGYDRMRIRWTPPNQTRAVSTEIGTDLADIGTAMFAKRELVSVSNEMSECTDVLIDEFVEAMIDKFE